MNLTASNEGQDSYCGDIEKLPYIHQRAGLVLSDEQIGQFLSTDDLVAMFDLFWLDEAWSPLFAFGEPLPAHQLGLQGDELLYLSSRVIPMGWQNATGVAQYLMRQLALHSYRLSRCLPPGREIRRDLILPRLECLPGDAEGIVIIWLAYLDGLDLEEFVEALEASWFSLTEMSSHQEHFQATVLKWNAPLHPTKSETRKVIGKRLGVALTGAGHRQSF